MEGAARSTSVDVVTSKGTGVEPPWPCGVSSAECGDGAGGLPGPPRVAEPNGCLAPPHRSSTPDTRPI